MWKSEVNGLTMLYEKATSHTILGKVKPRRQQGGKCLPGGQGEDRERKCVKHKGCLWW